MRFRDLDRAVKEYAEELGVNHGGLKINVSLAPLDKSDDFRYFGEVCEASPHKGEIFLLVDGEPNL